MIANHRVHCNSQPSLQMTNKEDTTVSSSTISNESRAGYAINLDPAAKYIPFTSSIDIRDTVDYIEVMKQHKLGPNGAILTCLNLFATKFDQVMNILERRCFGESIVLLMNKRMWVKRILRRQVNRQQKTPQQRQHHNRLPLTTS